MYDYLIVIVLLLLSATFSGLTLGLMSLKPSELKRKAHLGNKHAQAVYPLRKQGNLLLSTLLIGNVAVNAMLAIFLGSLTTGIVASLVATGLIVVFGEIIPQSLFSRHALRFGSRFVWLVYVFTWVLYPLTWPIAALLDKVLGGELPTLYSKQEVRLLLHEQKKLRSIDKQEFEILEGGLLFSDLSVRDAMTLRSRTFFVTVDDVLGPHLLKKISDAGHSRIPVLNKAKDRVVGLLYVKDIVRLNPQVKTKVRAVLRKRLLYVRSRDKLDKVLELFQTKRVHLMVVRDKPHQVLGIITLEDVLEKIVGDIIDEHDYVIRGR